MLIKASLPVLVVVVAVAVALNQQGYFAPFGSRVRALFVKHTRTGNPLVASVAEHQPANEQAYQHYLHHIYSIVPFGLVVSLLTQTVRRPGTRLLVVSSTCIRRARFGYGEGKG